MASNVITGQQWGPPAVGTRDGNWVWNGSNWICNPDCGTDGTPCPPMGPPVFSGPVAQPPWYPGANGGVSFGATAPANPVRGHMWWDGTSFWLFDGAAWVAVGGPGAGGGAATGTTPPANPFNGQQWFNGSTLYIWDGNAWVPTSTTKSYVQATAPPNPNPGDTWFDGTVQRIWDGSAWRTVGPGATVGPVPTTTKVFQLTMSSTSIALGGSSAYEIVPFTSTPQIDTESGWNSTTHQYKPTTPGYYAFFTNQYVTGPTTVWMGHSLLLNDAGSWQANSQNYVTAGFGGIQAVGGAQLFAESGMVHMNGTTDFVRLWAYSTDGNFYQLSTTMPTITAFLLP
jgi:hypothetical protein